MERTNTEGRGKRANAGGGAGPERRTPLHKTKHRRGAWRVGQRESRKQEPGPGLGTGEKKGQAGQGIWPVNTWVKSGAAVDRP